MASKVLLVLLPCLLFVVTVSAEDYDEDDTYQGKDTESETEPQTETETDQTETDTNPIVDENDDSGQNLTFYDKDNDNDDNFRRDQNSGIYGVRCQKCIVEKDMDNTVLSRYDETLSTTTNICAEHECVNGEDWCLVTYYKKRAYGGEQERKFEVHDCGTRSMRDSNQKCIELLQADDHQLIDDCHTKRSSASYATIYLSLVMAFITLWFAQ